MQANIEVTINDREWPELILVVKVGLQVRTEKARFDEAEVKFNTTVNEFVKNAVSSAVQRRKQNGT